VIIETIEVATPRQCNGANGERRVEGEVVIIGRRPRAD
jgi:hypothetical protein